MESQSKSRSMFGFNNNSDPDLNIPVSGGSSGLISPYLNFDPTTVNNDQYVLMEGAKHKRGTLETCFSQIGGSVMIGGMIGGMSGLYSCKTTTKGLSWKLARTQILNVVGKQGASSGQAFGVIALMYSVSCAGLEYAGVENEVNTLTSGTLTGLLFKSSAGLHGGLKGGAVGFGLSALYCLFYRSDVFTKSFLSR